MFLGGDYQNKRIVLRKFDLPMVCKITWQELKWVFLRLHRREFNCEHLFSTHYVLALNSFIHFHQPQMVGKEAEAQRK